MGVAASWGTDNATAFQNAANSCPVPTNSTLFTPNLGPKGCVIVVPNPGASGTGDYMFGSGVTLTTQTSYEILGMGNSSKWEGSQQAGVRLLTAMPITILTAGQSSGTAGTANYGGFHLDNISFVDTSANGSALGGLMIYNTSEAAISYCDFENFNGEIADPANDVSHTFPNIPAYGIKANPVGGTNNNIVLFHDKGKNNAVFYDSSIWGQDGPIVIGGDIFPVIPTPPGSNYNAGFSLPCYGFINAGPMQIYGTHFDTGANNYISSSPPPCWAVRMLNSGIIKAKFESSASPHGSGVWIQGGSTIPFGPMTLTRDANGRYVSTGTISANTLEQGEVVSVTGCTDVPETFDGHFILTSPSASTTLTWDQGGTASATANGCTVTGIATNASSIEGIFNALTTLTGPPAQGSIQIDNAAGNNKIFATIPSVSNPVPSFIDNGTNDSFEIKSSQAVSFTVGGGQTTTSGDRTIFTGTLQVPTAAGLTTASSGLIGYDTTGQVPHMFAAGGDAKVATFTASTSGNCVDWASATQIGDPGAGATLGCNNAVLVFYCNGSFNASTTGAFLIPGSAGTSCTNTLGTELPVPFAGTIRNLYVTTATGGASGGGTVKVYHNGSPTSLACPISTATSCHDISPSDAFTVTSSDTISVRVTTIASDTPSTARVTIQLQ
jgi:hypothetical protein